MIQVLNTDLSVSHLVRIQNLINEGSLQNNVNFNKFSLKYICKFAMKILALPCCLTHS